MWTSIKIEDFSRYVQQNPDIQLFSEDLKLSESNGNFILPRHTHHIAPSPLLRFLKDSTWSPKATQLTFTASLRDYQEKAMKSLENLWTQKQELTGIIEGRPGSGKTVLCAYISCFTKLKTLVLLDNSQLMTQWIESYEKFTSCQKVGIIQGPRFDKDHDVTIGMVQTFMSKARKDAADRLNFYNQIKEQGYGLVIFDECHKSSCAPKYAMASTFINTPNIIGCTATPPTIGTSHDFFIRGVIGNVVTTMKDYEHMPTMNFVKYNSTLTSGQLRRIKSAYDLQAGGDYIKFLGTYNSVLSDDAGWLAIIKRIAIHLDKTNHRTIIIVSTVKQVENVTKMLCDAGLAAAPFYSKKRTFDRDKVKLLVATQKYASAGFDWQELSALLLAIPMRGRIALIQTVGRILRACSGKEDPVVYDLIDMSVGSILNNMLEQKKTILQQEFTNATFKDYRT